MVPHTLEHLGRGALDRQPAVRLDRGAANHLLTAAVVMARTTVAAACLSNKIV